MTSNTIYHIQSSAAQNHQLLSELAQVEYAPSALEQQKSYIQDLRSQLTQTDKFLKDNQGKVRKEYADYVKYQKSTVRRFAYKLVGSKEEFAAKASKEEREYFDAVQEENKAKSQRDMFAKQLEEAEAAQIHFQQATYRHKELQAQLDALYNLIFAGPTPDFPEEDAVEWPVTQAQVSYGVIQRRLETQSQAMSLLQQARQSMDRVLADIKDALGWSTADIFGGGTWTDIAERNALSKAETGVSNVQMLILQAQRSDPSVQLVGTMDVVNGHIISDVIFDNIFTDVAMHNRIQDTMTRMRAASKKLDDELAGANSRRADLEEHAKHAAQVLESARSELQRVRQEAFERVNSGQVQQANLFSNPPPYDYGDVQQQW